MQSWSCAPHKLLAGFLFFFPAHVSSHRHPSAITLAPSRLITIPFRVQAGDKASAHLEDMSTQNALINISTVFPLRTESGVSILIKLPMVILIGSQG